MLLLLFADRHGNLRVLLTLRASNMSSYAGQVSLPGGKADTITESPFKTARREAFEEIGLPADYLPSPFRVEHLCELPSHVAITELGVRPCVAFLHTDGSMNSKGPSFTPASPSSSDGEGEPAKGDSEVTGESLLPKLNATEVAAIFSCPFHRFISSCVERKETESPIKYYGQWNNWNGVKWRMHKFFIPKTHVRTSEHKTSHEVERGNSGDNLENSHYKVWGLTARILIDSARIAYDEDPEFEFNQGIGEEAMLKRLWDRGRLKGERKQGDKIPRQTIENIKNEAEEEDVEEEDGRVKRNKL